ncbi:hypothetical protein LCGC14_0594800 [marine sediment metagenome]|uniref:NYN domain-containing protein n=1 Tax=marine sediment metagenome TaxID=412755 RepID=A0A0F9RW15_9ZZZZ
MSNNKRIMIFIDHNNLFYEYRRLGIVFKYIPLVRIISQERSIDKIFTYMGTEYLRDRKRIVNREKFFQLLKRKGITVRKIPLVEKPGGKQKEKEVDISLAIDILDFAFKNELDRAILVSGDGDFRPVIKRLQKYNKEIEIWSFRNTLSSRLKQTVEAGDIHYLDDYLS